MSGQGSASFIKYSSPTEFDLHHYNYKNKRKSRMIKFLTLVCIGLALVLFLHEGYHWQKSCENGNKRKNEGETETLTIISFETPMDKISVRDFGDVTELDEKVCTPGSSKKMDCNTCTCNEEGTAYGCTKMACTSLKRVLFPKCTPGTTKNVKCNTCVCNEDGTGYGCTKMACIDQKKGDSKQECVPGSIKKMDCNSCTCNEEGTGYGCTKMLCSGLQLDIGGSEEDPKNEEKEE